MASLSLFVIERHSRVWLLRLLIHQSDQSKLPILSEIPWRKSLWSQFKVLTAGRLYKLDVKLLQGLSLLLFEDPLA